MIPIEFVLFGAVLLGVAVAHRHALAIAAAGAAVIILYKLLFSSFGPDSGTGVIGLAHHLQHEWVVLINLLLLLLGFTLLANTFEESGIPAVLPRWLPDSWLGGFSLLAVIFLLSGFLDNIAAAMIGGAIAHTVYRGRVHIAFVVAVAAAANAGGAGSVLGDTTTTMMWIAGVPPSQVLEAYLAAVISLVISGSPAAIIQQRHSPIQREATTATAIDWTRALIVVTILTAVVLTNIVVNSRYPDIADSFPFLGMAVMGVILLSALVRRPAWGLLGPALTGAMFLVALVLCASMMPVETLPAATWQSTFGLGLLSSVFDNIPLTALALKQGGYDWGLLAYAVGFGGSLMWFGSSAGVALTVTYPEARSASLWLRHGWYVIVAYVAGFLGLLVTLGFRP